MLKWLLSSALVLIAVLVVLHAGEAGPPLIPGRAIAIQRGIEFIHTTAMVEKNFAVYGSDYLWCFCSIARTSSDLRLRRAAWRMGHELALRWRREHRQVDPAARAHAVFDLVAGSQAADCLGVPDPALLPSLRDAASRVQATNLFGFDPAKEPPPADIPEPCEKCGFDSARGTRICPRCGAALSMWNRYAVFCDAIIMAFTGERYGMKLGASLDEVLQWRARLLPYPDPKPGDDAEYRDALYAITHIVYALNDYSSYRLRPEWLPREYAFLKAHCAYSIATGDAEMAGEYLDTLKSFGLTAADSLMGKGMRFLMASQNPDGSWGDPADPDIYNRYHSTWTAVDGLRDYSWSGEGVPAPVARRYVRFGPGAVLP